MKFSTFAVLACLVLSTGCLSRKVEKDNPQTSSSSSGSANGNDADNGNGISAAELAGSY